MKKYISFFIIIAVVSLLTACFSPWTGDSSITINLGRSTGRFVFDDESQIEGFEYNITLRGPGGTITKHVKESGPVTFQVVPGSWTVDVRAIGQNIWYDDPPSALRAIGLEANIEVKAGVNKAVPLEMKPAREVSNWQELCDAVNEANNLGKEEIIVINANTKEMVVEDTLSISTSTGNPDIYKIAIISDGDVTLKRTSEEASAEPPYLYSFFDIYMNGTLTLGKPGMTGTITLDGGWERGSDFPLEAWNSLISVNTSGTLVMNEGAKLTNNYYPFGSGGGVHVSYGDFIMKGGEISGNLASYGGGGVYIYEGSFEMEGGTINLNETDDQGGGVYIFHDTGWGEGDGSFLMSGTAVISGNVASNGGGGVYIDGGTFTMEGGFIKLNETLYKGGGVYVENSGTFNMSGSAVIDDNTAFGNGGGVFVMEGDVTMKGNAVIKNNTAYGAMGGGVCIYSVDNPASFEMLGGSIESNKCLLGDEHIFPYGGGGVYNGAAYFKMNGGSITKNEIPEDGHGAGLYGTSDSTNEVDESRITGNLINGVVAPVVPINEQYYKEP